MTKVYNRITDLHEVLVYTAKHAPNRFTPGQRICIHQERAALFNVVNPDHPDYKGEPKYVAPAIVRKKITETLQWMHQK